MSRVIRAVALSLALSAAFALASAVASTAQRGSAGASAHVGSARAASARAAGGGILIPSYPGEILPLSSKTIHSANWSGYAVTSPGGHITAVAGSFVVPKVGSAPFGFAATWAGIGGYKTHDLIQAGAGEDSSSGGLFGKQYFAWYELLPNAETQLHGCHGDTHCKVRPGEHISVSIRNTSGQTWKISVRDAGHWTFTKRVTYHSSKTSAEWILEAPTVGTQTTLAPVGITHFGPTSTYVSGGVSRRMAKGHPVKIILTGEAKPSAIASNGQSFNDCAYRGGTCPRP